MRRARLPEAVQAPVLVLVGVDPAGDQDPALREGAGEALHHGAELHPAVLGLRHLVQAVQEEEATLLPELPFELVAVAAEASPL